MKKTWNIEEEKILKIQTTFQQYQKLYNTPPYDMVHVLTKFRENTSMRFRVTVRKINVMNRRTDRQTDGRTGALQYLPSRAFGAAGQPRRLSGLRRSRVHSLMIARRSLCPEKLGSNPGQGSKGINFSGWHGLDMSITVTKRRQTPTNLRRGGR